MSSTASSGEVKNAKSLLFVPANRPDRFAKALESEASAIIIDLEDAVAEDCKDSARAQLVTYLPLLNADQLMRTAVRVNAVDSRFHTDDISALREWAACGVTLMLPKSESAVAIAQVAQQLGPQGQIVALVESLAGLDALDLLARAPQVVRLAFGHLDFQLDMGMRCRPEEPELTYARFAFVAASRRAGLPPPVDGVTTDLGNSERLALDTQRARAFGFGAKLCIHPAQVAVVNQMLGHTKAERDWAQRVLTGAEAHLGAAFSLDGKMVDLPVIRLAQNILAGQ
jgi:citrate lyase subunit beta/citryl-CoA lyase